ncbi:MAG: hypothetical protein GKS05_09085 [Nitrospirales bacterium]|nr:hypothetical protein [Nitrospirales bacterium]
MNDVPPLPALLECLSTELEPSQAKDLCQAFTLAGVAEPVLDLCDELHQTSGKVARMAIAALPELYRRCDAVTVVPWLDLGISLASASGALALKYVRESPLLLGLIEPTAVRQQVLALVLELADNQSEHATNAAFEFFRKAPELLLHVSVDTLAYWAEVGIELTNKDFVLGVEFFKESPAIAQVLSHDQVRPWVTFGTKLITQNSLGNTDYVGTLEFFRSSPAILSDISELELRIKVITVGSILAERFPQGAIEFLAEVPQLLRKLPSHLWRGRVLQYAALLAEQDAESALAYVRRCPNFLSMAGVSEETEGTSAAFQKWFAAGMEILDYSPEGARAYFALETRKALASLEQAMSGVSLQQVVRPLTLFAHMICGEHVKIEPNAMPSSSTENTFPQDAQVHKHLNEQEKGGGRGTGSTVYLPNLVNKYPTREANRRLYTVMTAHELGHREFGTYRLNFSKLHDLFNEVRIRYGMADSLPTSPVTLMDLFAGYPQKSVIQDLWMVLEDARVEDRLQSEYPGLKQDLAELAQEAVRTHSLLHGMTAREMVMDALLLLFSTCDTQSVAIRQDLNLVVERAWGEAKTVLQPNCTAEDVIVVADRIYQILDDMIGRFRTEGEPAVDQTPEEAEADLGAGPRASEETSGEYRPITNWAYRGAMDPEWVEGQMDIADNHGNDENPDALSHETGSLNKQTQDHDTDHALLGEPQVLLPSHEQLSSVDPLKRTSDSDSHEREGIVYDEWDGVIQDYRTKWCRVVERSGPAGSGDFVSSVLAARGPAVRLLRRYFESIRPTALRRVYAQEDGDEVDWDALIQWVVDRRVGVEASDRVYIRRDKRERQVAVAFLIDMSGSTGRQLGSGQQRVIDVEKESLVVMSEALEAIGDAYALYGFSGQGRDQVDFIVLKDFDHTQLPQTGQRIGAVTPLQQNRDGAAIRHTVKKLLSCPARHRLCILVSDGKPLDNGYADEYALEDTKMALREARLSGVLPFCLTVDQGASDYLKRMYGDVGFLIMNDVMALPERLPKVYQRLTIT